MSICLQNYSRSNTRYWFHSRSSSSPKTTIGTGLSATSASTSITIIINFIITAINIAITNHGHLKRQLAAIRNCSKEGNDDCQTKYTKGGNLTTSHSLLVTVSTYQSRSDRDVERRNSPIPPGILPCQKFFFQKYKIWGWKSSILGDLGAELKFRAPIISSMGNLQPSVESSDATILVFGIRYDINTILPNIAISIRYGYFISK